MAMNYYQVLAVAIREMQDATRRNDTPPGHRRHAHMAEGAPARAGQPPGMAGLSEGTGHKSG